MDNETLAMEMLKELKSNAKRKFIIIIILIIALVGTNAFWIIKDYNEEYETITEKTTVDSGDDGMATYLENSEGGDIIYGKDN